MAIPQPLEKYLTPAYWHRRANLPVPLLRSTWEEAEEADSELAEYAREIVQVWAEGGWQGIAIFGPPGRGKTSLTVVMVKEFIDRWLAKQRFPEVASKWPPAHFMTLAEYHQLGFEQMETARMIDRAPEEWPSLAAEWNEARVLRHWVTNEVPVLVLDDIGKEHNSRSGYTESGFYALMRGRFSKGLATSMTSNLTGEEFMASYGEAQFSFLHEACLVLNTEGEDYRLENA